MLLDSVMLLLVSDQQRLHDFSLTLKLSRAT